MGGKKVFLLLDLVLISLISFSILINLFSSMVYADDSSINDPPLMPCYFYGYIFMNSELVREEVVVQAEINDEIVEETETDNGEYNLVIEARQGEGKKVALKVLDQEKIKGWASGGQIRTDFYLEKEEEQKPSCEEDWQCTSWSRCQNGIRTRTCWDENDCRTNYHKPHLGEICQEQDDRDENGCEEDYVCGPWSSCEDDKRIRICQDQNCGHPDREEYKACQDDSRCIPKWECLQGECLDGIKELRCVDKNGCKEDKTAESKCTTEQGKNETIKLQSGKNQGEKKQAEQEVIVYNQEPITLYQPKPTNNNQILILFWIVELIIVAVLIIFLFFKIKKIR